jgi:lipopolysaccharide transport protein LptA
MVWQKQARALIAIFVVVFATIVGMALRQQKRPAVPAPAPEQKAKGSVYEVHGPGEFNNFKDKHTISIKFEDQIAYPDGRTVQKNITMLLPDRGGRSITIVAKAGERTAQPGQEVGRIHLTGGLKLTTSDNISVTSNEATYDDGTGLLEIPGAVAFSHNRMSGTGVGATYDKNRDVLWLLDQAHISVSADDQGHGALEGTAGSAGFARADHYARLQKAAHIVGQGHVMDADEIVIHMTEDDQRAKLVELRTNSRITAGRGASGPQAMTANNIDLTYGDDGRTLQHALLMENGVVQLPGEGKSPGQRIAGKTIDVALAPDGTTVTNLNATEAVQVDLPQDGDSPAKRIRAATLLATGPPAGGLQSATFAGNVDYHESRAARGALAAVDRQARSNSLVVQTRPGFGALQEADFRGMVHITDGAQVGDAPQVLYHVEKNQMELSPSAGGEPGMGPRVTDTRVSIEAKTIVMTVGSNRISAESSVRSVMLPQNEPAAGRGAAGRGAPGGDVRTPSMLKQDQPVNVTSNRLAYDGDVGKATYSGNAKLWQGDTTLHGDTIVVDDKTGNLEAHTGVTSTMLLDEVDKETGQRKATRSVGKSEHFSYDDAKRIATYTAKANLVGPEGDLTAEKIELFLKPNDNELERLLATGPAGTVLVKDPMRTVHGDQLIYTAADETYDMIGKPVVAIETKPNECTQTEGKNLLFRRAVDTIFIRGSNAPLKGKPIACPTGTH